MKKRNEKTTIKGTNGAQFLDKLVIEKKDKIIIKKKWSAFFNTSLEQQLKKLRINNIIIAGIYTHARVRTTAIDAYQRDYNVVLAKDCISSWDKKHEEITLSYLNLGLKIPLLSNNQIKNIV